MAFFGVNFFPQKFCPCKKNDKYQVWVFDVFPKIVVIYKFPGTVNNSQAAEFRRWRPIFQNNRPNIDKPVKFTCRGFLLIILSFLLLFFFFSTFRCFGFFENVNFFFIFSHALFKTKDEWFHWNITVITLSSFTNMFVYIHMLLSTYCSLFCLFCFVYS